MRFQIRDGSTGDIVPEAQGDLRTRASDRWARDGMRLIKQRLLEVRERP